MILLLLFPYFLRLAMKVNKSNKAMPRRVSIYFGIFLGFGGIRAGSFAAVERLAFLMAGLFRERFPASPCCGPLFNRWGCLVSCSGDVVLFTK